MMDLGPGAPTKFSEFDCSEHPQHTANFETPMNISTLPTRSDLLQVHCDMAQGAGSFALRQHRNTVYLFGLNLNLI